MKGSFDAPRMSSFGMYSSTTSEPARTAREPPTQRPTVYNSAAGRTAAVREFFHSEVVLLHHIEISMFLRSLAISGTGGGSCRRPPLVEFGFEALYSPIILYAVWGGRSTVARSRGGTFTLGRAFSKWGILKTR